MATPKKAFEMPDKLYLCRRSTGEIEPWPGETTRESIAYIRADLVRPLLYDVSLVLTRMTRTDYDGVDYLLDEEVKVLNRDHEKIKKILDK